MLRCEGGADGPLTVELAKQLLGWQEESENIKFGSNFLFKDKHGRKIRCLNNLTNRPFVSSLANDWMLEILRRKWRLNGEAIIIDRTAMVQDGQHRLIGFVLAAQEWELHKDRWREFWKHEPTMDTLIVVGISEDDDTVNTIGVGKTRSLADVIFRSELFSSLPYKDRMKISRVAGFAIKLLWLRTGADLTSFVPKRSHSESLEFIDRHPRILDCIKHIVEENGGGEKRISRYIGLGYASALMYLMGAAMSDQDAYDQANSEEGVDWSLWEKAEEFWVQFAAGGEELKPLRDALKNVEEGGSFGRDESVGLTVKAWNAYCDGETLGPDTLYMLRTEDELDRPVLGEHPLIGGIDVGSYRAPTTDEA